MSSLPLITKYRPRTFDMVLGNETAVTALADAVKSESRPHAYLFTGSSGIGKTTLARIIAKEIGAMINEIDAATKGGIDDAREIVTASGYKPLNGQPMMYIIDEAQGLSSKAWDALLKIIEEPPSYLYFAFSTTEPSKVPKAIVTRSYPVSLRSLKPNDIDDLLTFVAELEGWTVAPDTFQGIIIAADGSARMALSILQAGHAVTSRDELSKIIMEVESDISPAVELAKYLLGGGRAWKHISQLLKDIKGDEEAAIFDISRYLAGALVKSEEQQAQEIYRMLRSFTETDTWDKRIHFYCGIGKILWGQLPF